MSTVSRIALKWCVIGLIYGIIVGVLGYFFMNGKSLSEPPAWALLLITMAFAVPAAVREAYAAGANSSEK